MGHTDGYNLKINIGQEKIVRVEVAEEQFFKYFFIN